MSVPWVRHQAEHNIRAEGCIDTLDEYLQDAHKGFHDDASNYSRIGTCEYNPEHHEKAGNGGHHPEQLFGAVEFEDAAGI